MWVQLTTGLRKNITSARPRATAGIALGTNAIVSITPRPRTFSRITAHEMMNETPIVTTAADTAMITVVCTASRATGLLIHSVKLEIVRLPNDSNDGGRYVGSRAA